jgi:predicted small lipoprotein YifL
MSARAVRGWIAACAALLACAGCGFKGNLYLPERNTTVVTHAPQQTQGAQGASAPGQPQASGTTQPSSTGKKAKTSPPP